jgi:hypothetical protein
MFKQQSDKADPSNEFDGYILLGCRNWDSERINNQQFAPIRHPKAFQVKKKLTVNFIVAEI